MCPCKFQLVTSQIASGVQIGMPTITRYCLHSFVSSLVAAATDYQLFSFTVKFPILQLSDMIANKQKTDFLLMTKFSPNIKKKPLLVSYSLNTSETSAGSEFLSFFVLHSRLLADFLSHLGKWVKLIKFEAENECFCTWKVEKPQSTPSTP